MARAADNRVWHRWHNAQGWSVVEHLDGSLVGAPALSSPERGRLDLFARDASGRVVWKSWNDAQWLGWLHAPSP
jgi:hypothetical protein